MVFRRIISGFWGRRWQGAVLAILAAVVLSGCSTYSHYPQGMEQTTLQSLRTGKRVDAEKNFGKRTQGNSGVVFALEMGRVAQLEGDYEISRQAFTTAIEATREQDEKAVISASGAAAQGAAVLVNDKAIPYRAPDYERTLMHHYQMLNYLGLQDLNGAGVEVRRANKTQKDAQERRAREIERAKSFQQNVPESEDGKADERDPHLIPVYAGLDEMAGSVKYSFLNAATLFLSGVVWEMLGEQNDAYIDYKKSIEIYPDNVYLQRAVIRLSRRLGMREDAADFSRRFPGAAAVAAPPQGMARLVVMFEQGLAPQKSDMSLAYPLSGGSSLGVISLPIYADPVPPLVTGSVRVGGKSAGKTAPLCNVSALAARALADQMPGILTRQVARAIAKGSAAQVAGDSGGEWAELLVTLYNVVSEQPDLRSWLTLPAHIQVLDAWAEPGTKKVEISAGGATVFSGEVTFTAGRTTIISVTTIDLAVYSHVIMQP
ncbi:MAG: hypothetical protein WBI79_05670 [Kiritimatiellia bacterium]